MAEDPLRIVQLISAILPAMITGDTLLPGWDHCGRDNRSLQVNPTSAPTWMEAGAGMMRTGVVVSTREVDDSSSLTVSEGVNALVLNASHGSACSERC